MTSRYFNEKNEIVKEKKTGDVLLDPRVRPWYKGAKAAMANFWTDPYIFASTRKPGITSASPVVTESGKFLGVVAADITLGELSNFLRGLKVSENGRIYLHVGHNGTDDICYLHVFRTGSYTLLAVHMGTFFGRIGCRQQRKDNYQNTYPSQSLVVVRISGHLPR